MDEKKPASAWDDLVEELGVEANPNALERRQPKPTELPSVSKALDPEKPRQAPKPKPGDWNALAGSLGVEVPRERDEATPEVDDELPELRSEFDKALVESSGDSDLEDESTLESGISGEAARTAFDALFSDTASDWALPTSAGSVLDTPLEFSQFTEEEGVAEEEFDSELAEEKPATEPPKRRRPRRRRRGRGGRGTREETTDRDRDETASDSDRPDDELELESAADDDQDEDESTSAEVDREEKPRRRRPRRRRGRGDREERAPVSAKPVAASDEEDEEDEEESDDSPAAQGGLFDLGDEEDEDDEVDGDEVDSGRQRSNHRNLPTWSEAIGVIVDANMVQRSKAPARPSSPRGRGRGGRGRKRS